ncbi:hypothetical protein KQI84_12385 [bacterium]|nr:hypothetical protein [bacterium]
MSIASILAIRLAESFAPDNPWVRRVTSLPIPPRRRLGDWLRLAIVALLAMVLPALWFVALEGLVDGFTGFVATVSYTMAVSIAFISPALGAAAREHLEKDPLLPQAMVTYLTDRDALAAVHGRLLSWVFLAVTVPATMAFFLILMIHTDYAAAASDMRYTVIHHFLGPIRFWGILSQNNPTWNWIATGTGVLMAVNYGAGCYLRASILAGVCQLNPSSRWWGGLTTAGLVMLNMITLLARVLVPYSISRVVGVPIDLGTGFVILGLMEVGFIVGRLAMARRFWRRTLAVGLDETRAYLDMDSSGGRFVS